MRRNENRSILYNSDSECCYALKNPKNALKKMLLCPNNSKEKNAISLFLFLFLLIPFFILIVLV